MTTEIVKLVHSHLVYMRFSGQITLDDLSLASEQLQDLIAGITHPIHIIIELIAVESIPLNPKAIIASATFLQQPYLGWLILVHADEHNMLINMMSTIVTQMAHLNFKIVADIENAIQFLQGVDIELKDWVFDPIILE